MKNIQSSTLSWKNNNFMTIERCRKVRKIDFLRILCNYLGIKFQFRNAISLAPKSWIGKLLLTGLHLCERWGEPTIYTQENFRLFRFKIFPRKTSLPTRIGLMRVHRFKFEGTQPSRPCSFLFWLKFLNWATSNCTHITCGNKSKSNFIGRAWTCHLIRDLSAQKKWLTKDILWKLW